MASPDDVIRLSRNEGQAVESEDTLFDDLIRALLVAFEFGQQLQKDGIGTADGSLLRHALVMAQ